jgi:hypothetical protein
MERIGQFLLSLIAELSALDLSPVGEADTTALEISLLQKAFGPGLYFLMDIIGLPQLQTRQDLDSLAFRLQEMFRLK